MPASSSLALMKIAHHGSPTLPHFAEAMNFSMPRLVPTSWKPMSLRAAASQGGSAGAVGAAGVDAAGAGAAGAVPERNKPIAAWISDTTTLCDGLAGAGLADGGAAGFAAAIARAAARTSRTRRPQPLPNTLHVPRPCRKARRSSQILLMSPVALARAAAAMVLGPISPSMSAPTKRCSTFALRPTPEFTPKSKTA